jgi:hypothetical protein
MLDVTAAGWAATLALIAALLILDWLLLGRRPHMVRPHMVSFGEAARWSAFYIAVAILFRFGESPCGDRRPLARTPCPAPRASPASPVIDTTPVDVAKTNACVARYRNSRDSRRPPTNLCIATRFRSRIAPDQRSDNEGQTPLPEFRRW